MCDIKPHHHQHGLKLLEKIIDRRLREPVSINQMQFGFSKGRGTTDVIFILRQVQEKMLDKKKKVYIAFLDLERAYNRVPRGSLLVPTEERDARTNDKDGAGNI